MDEMKCFFHGKSCVSRRYVVFGDVSAKSLCELYFFVVKLYIAWIHVFEQDFTEFHKQDTADRTQTYVHSKLLATGLKSYLFCGITSRRSLLLFGTVEPYSASVFKIK